MKKKALIFFLFCLILIISAQTKNINEKFVVLRNMKLTSTFCDYRDDHFHTGIDLGASDEDVLSPVDGEIVFHNSDRKGAIKYGNGNFAVLEDFNHTLRFNFSHLKDGSFQNDKIFYKKGDYIALTGNSGHSTGAHLHLEIEDIINNRLLNPLKYLDIEDTVQPRIRDIYFILDDNSKITLSNWKNYKVLRGGKLFIECSDTIEGSNYEITPYKIAVYIDGYEKSILKLDYLDKRNNEFIVGKMKFSDLYQDNENFIYYLMDFYSLPGILGLKVVVEDINGNKREFARNIIIEFPEKKEK